MPTTVADGYKSRYKGKDGEEGAKQKRDTFISSPSFVACVKSYGGCLLRSGLRVPTNNVTKCMCTHNAFSQALYSIRQVAGSSVKMSNVLAAGDSFHISSARLWRCLGHVTH